MPDASTAIVTVSLHGLRASLPFLALAAVFVASGLATIVLWRLRSREPLLLWLGTLTVLYGLRLGLTNGLTALALGLSETWVTTISALITTLIFMPFILFFRELFGATGRKFANILLWLQILFMPLGLILILLEKWDAFWTINNAVTIVGALYIVGIIFTPQVASSLRWSLGTFVALVLATNFGFRVAGADIEPVGFAVLIGGLAFAAAGRAIARERKLHEVESELETARRIQASILPRTLPTVPGLSITARYEPMTQVAGDFYDFLTTPDGLTMLVADVSGHGVPAALIASMLKVAFEAQSHNADDPAKILGALNAMLARPLEGKFVTAACAHIDRENGLITYAGAGHPPALLVRADGEVVELAENGLMLGPFRAAQYSSIQVSFGPGDRLLLYTDGIIEATVSDGQEFGLDRLKEFARTNQRTLADLLIAAVSHGVREDDLTVVVAEAC